MPSIPPSRVTYHLEYITVGEVGNGWVYALYRTTPDHLLLSRIYDSMDDAFNSAAAQGGRGWVLAAISRGIFEPVAIYELGDIEWRPIPHESMIENLNLWDRSTIIEIMT